MATSLLNSSLRSIDYAGVRGDSAILTISDSPESGAMLLESASVNFNRGVQLRNFMNGTTAAFVGVGNGTVSLSGLFGSSEQIKNLLGTQANPCKLARTITLKAGMLTKCSETGENTKMGATITLHGCIVTGFSLTSQVQQDGQIYESATVQMLLTDVTVD